MTSSSRAAVLLHVGLISGFLVGTLAASGVALADESESAGAVPVNVIVVHTSDGEGGIDPRARALDAELRKQIRYRSMRVLRQERIDLHIDEVGTIPLPDGRKVRVQPMHKGKEGVLMAVDVEGAVKLDARARNHHRVVIGAGAFEDGQLAISLEPDYEE